MLSGYNNNIRHRGNVYHVQTEDNGEANPWIVTHAYLGGAILATERSSYQDLLGDAAWRDVLRERMKSQHLEMIRRVIAGSTDSGEGPSPG
jgi:hypothetical protein